jgi:hypothetical protein
MQTAPHISRALAVESGMNRFFFFAAMSGAFLSQPALADTRDEVYARLQSCRVIQDDRAWLNCTYGAEQPMRAKLGLPPAPDFQQRLVPSAPVAGTSPAYPGPDYGVPVNTMPRSAQPAVAPPHRSASFLQVLTGSAPVVAASPLASIRYDSAGAFIVTLENGQIWHQENNQGEAKVRFKIGTNVTVKPAALGSYNLQTSDNPHVYKVKPRT